MKAAGNFVLMTKGCSQEGHSDSVDGDDHANPESPLRCENLVTLQILFEGQRPFDVV